MSSYVLSWDLMCHSTVIIISESTSFDLYVFLLQQGHHIKSNPFLDAGIRVWINLMNETYPVQECLDHTMKASFLKCLHCCKFQNALHHNLWSSFRVFSRF